MQSDYLKILWGAEAWRAEKSVDPVAYISVEALRIRKCKQANTTAEKEEMLLLESFTLTDDDQ